jgi:RNA polymerase sigma factor (sigma-70 family)
MHTPVTAAAPPSTEVDDRLLVRRYVEQRDETAFAELVRRHARLVLGVCRRVLRHDQDLEDAFQATFLVLARDAGRLRKRESLACWLHGVAYRTALRTIAGRHRRLSLLEDVAMPEDRSSLEELVLRHERQALDRELQSLSEKYRAPLVLHYLEGLSVPRIARKLGLSVSAVEGRLKRGRGELRLRLARHGLGLSVALAALQLVPRELPAAELASLIDSSVRAGLSYSAGESAGPLYSPEVARLAGQEITIMSTGSTLTVAAALLAPLTLILSGHGGSADSNAAMLRMGDRAPVVATMGEAAGIPVEMTIAQLTEPPAEPPAEPPVRVEAQSAEEATDDGPQVDPLTAGSRNMNRSPWSSGSDAKPSAESLIESQLSVPTTVEFVETPLADAVMFLSDRHGISIVLDESSLADHGIGTDVPITVSLNGVRLESALNRMLRPLSLDYAVRDEVLEITTVGTAHELLTPRIYPVPADFGMEPSALQDTLMRSVPDLNWFDVDGEGGTIQPIPHGLLITQTFRGHRLVRDLLDELRRHLAAGVGPVYGEAGLMDGTAGLYYKEPAGNSSTVRQQGSSPKSSQPDSAEQTHIIELDQKFMDQYGDVLTQIAEDYVSRATLIPHGVVIRCDESTLRDVRAALERLQVHAQKYPQRSDPHGFGSGGGGFF